ncbi:TolC family protein [Hoylesella buccalis]|uniref:TolC family protein n=1 Tax=Hoylesella buccalis TaxID=28127 RepID=UPI00399612E8
MKIQNIMIMGLAALALTSCKSLYGTYQRPNVNTKGIVRDSLSMSDTLVVTDTTSFGNMPWRSVFTDPQLQMHIERALTNNVDLLNAALNVKMAEAQLKAARLSFLPSFTFAPQGTIASWDGGKAISTYQLPVAASWNVDLFGNLLNQKRAAQVALLATKDYQTLVKTNIISGVANMYYTLLMLDKQLDIVNNMHELTKETWDKMKVLKDLGRGIRSTGVQSAEANYYAVEAKKTDLVRQIRETENALSLLMGQPAQSISRGKLENQALPTNLSTGIGIQLLANRPDVHAAEMQLAECFYGVETARSRFYPSLTIAPTGMFTNSAGAAVINPGKWMLSAVGSLVQPIFQKGKIIAGLRVAEAQYEKAYNTWQNSILKAGNEVSNALVLYHSSDEKSKIEAKQIQTLQQNVEDTKLLLSQSSSTYLEVITAQQTLLNAQMAKITDDFHKMQAVVSLYQALGGGVKE